MAKPAWVRREVIRLKALMREDGTCRAVADVFNRRFAATRNMTVGKTFVAEAIRAHQHEILAARREIKRARSSASSSTQAARSFGSRRCRANRAGR